MEITLNNIKFTNVPNKKLGTQLGNRLTQSNIGVSQTTADYIVSSGFYYLANAIDIDWNGIEINNDTTINSTADLITWIKSIASSVGNGISVSGASINNNGHLIITLSDNSTIDAGVAKGADGNTPTITASKSGKTTTIKADNTSIATINDGTDGHTPVITATKSNGVASIKVDGTEIVQINDGTSGTGTQLDGIYYYTEIGELINDPQDSIYQVIGIAVIKGDVKFILDINDYSANNTKKITNKTGKDIAAIGADSLTDGMANTMALVRAEGFPESVDVNDWRGTAAMDCQTRTLNISNSASNYGFGGYNTRNGSPITSVHGYLPSLKEMMVIAENRNTINTMLTAVEGDTIDGSTYAISTIMPSIVGYVGTTPYGIYGVNPYSGSFREGNSNMEFRTLYPLVAYAVEDENYDRTISTI